MVEWEKSIREGKWLVTDSKLRNESITIPEDGKRS